MNEDEERVWRAAARSSANSTNSRVYISDVWEASGLSLDRVHAALLHLQSRGKLVLMRLDNTPELERLPKVKRATLYIAGYPRHLLYLSELPRATHVSMGQRPEKVKSKKMATKKTRSTTHKTKRRASKKNADSISTAQEMKTLTTLLKRNNISKQYFLTRKAEIAVRKRRSKKSHKGASITLEGLKKGVYKTWKCRGKTRTGCGGGARVVR